MSFEKLNETSINNQNERSCIMVVNFNKKEIGMIKNIGRLVGIRDCISLDYKNGQSKIVDILNDNVLTDGEETWTNKAIIFNNIEQMKINGFLESLKKMKIQRPLSAVVTETTIDWTLSKLVYNLLEERKALNLGKSAHK
ncbi:MAG: DUF3783 domain-containing protein [Terrisporobacter sp.]|uniref:DUF3783 domain-containing protein n=1 Tax=Terrisporobacter sp. TaxID=1965305 RepID=UPI002FCB2332